VKILADSVFPPACRQRYVSPLFNALRKETPIAPFPLSIYPTLDFLKKRTGIIDLKLNIIIFVNVSR